MLTFYSSVHLLLDTTKLCPRETVFTAPPPCEFPVCSPKLLCLSLTSHPPSRLPNLTILALFHMSVSVPCRKFSHNAVNARLLSLAVYFKPFIFHRFIFFLHTRPPTELKTTNGQSGKFRAHKLLLFL